MQALVKTSQGAGNLELHEVQEPQPGPGQVKLEVSACGICGTDIHVLHDTYRNYPPVILGHEIVGRVVEKGEAVDRQADLSGRYAVLGATTIICGHCEWCQCGEFMFCHNRRGMGHGVNGGFARYICARPDQLFRLEDSLDEEEGALVEPLAAAVHAVAEVASVRAGDTALVSGPGPIGLLCLLVLTHIGARTIVAGAALDEQRLAFAKSLGAARVVNVQDEDLLSVLQDETKGSGIDVAFEVAGVASSAAACLNGLRPFGQYIQVGHFGGRIEAPLDCLGFKQLNMKGSVGYTVATWRRTMNLLARGLKPSRIVTHRFPLGNWKEGFDLFEQKKALKVLLKP